MRNLVIGLVVALALAAPARAQEAAAFSADGLRITYAGWRAVPVRSGGLEAMVEIEPIAQGLPLRNCRLERRVLAHDPAMTQAELNRRILARADSNFVQSSVLSEIGDVDAVSSVTVDGVAVMDITMRGRGDGNPDWMRDRTFLRVNAAGEVIYHRLACVIFGAATQAHRDELNAIADSLRFDRTSP